MPESSTATSTCENPCDQNVEQQPFYRVRDTLDIALALMSSSSATTRRFDRLFDRREVTRSGWWAAGITVPLCIFGWAASMALAHAGGFVHVFFAPALVVLKLTSQSGPIPVASEALHISR